MKKNMKIVAAFAGFCLLWAHATGQTFTPPVIDGTIDAVWSTTPQLDATKTVMNQGVTNTADFSGFCRVLWDNTAIYLLAVVHDDILVNNMATSSDNDCVEFYLDLDNSKNACDECPWPAHAYDPNDFQFRFVWGKDGVAAYKHFLVKGGELDTGFDLDGIFSAQNRTATPGTWVIEVKIPWTNLLFAPVPVNSKIGYDFEMIDNDGTARDARFGWNHTADNAWQAPAIFGILKMLASGVVECGG
jgi:endo-1,4-beta-xylanase